MRAASDLPEAERIRFVERVNKRAYRERWLDEARSLAKPRDNGSLPLSKSVQSGSDSLATALRADSDKTKTALAKAARRGAEHLAEAAPAVLVEGSKALKDFAGVGSIVHGWEHEQQGSGTFGGLRVHSQQTIINVDQRKADST